MYCTCISGNNTSGSKFLKYFHNINILYCTCTCTCTARARARVRVRVRKYLRTTLYSCTRTVGYKCCDMILHTCTLLPSYYSTRVHAHVQRTRLHARCTVLPYLRRYLVGTLVDSGYQRKDTSYEGTTYFRKYP